MTISEEILYKNCLFFYVYIFLLNLVCSSSINPLQSTTTSQLISQNYQPTINEQTSNNLIELKSEYTDPSETNNNDNSGVPPPHPINDNNPNSFS